MSNTIYMHLAYAAYKGLEDQCKLFKETTHITEGGFYHKSIRLLIGDTIIEFHGPLTGAHIQMGEGVENDTTTEVRTGNGRAKNIRGSGAFTEMYSKRERHLLSANKPNRVRRGKPGRRKGK